VDAHRYTLALDEARRALDRQADEVSSIRARTTAFVSVGGLAAAFVGGLAVRDDASLTVWAALGAILLALLLGVAVAPPWPRNLHPPRPFHDQPLKTIADIDYATMAGRLVQQPAPPQHPRDDPASRIRTRPLRCPQDRDAARLRPAQHP
jgi:hypothetical protein